MSIFYKILAEDESKLDDFLDAVTEELKKHNVDTPEGSYWVCSEVTHSLLKIAKKLGIEAEAVGCFLKYPANAKYVDDDLKDTAVGHTFIKLGAFYVDFTLRQFQPEAAYPATIPVGSAEADKVFGKVHKRPKSEGKQISCGAWVSTAMAAIEKKLAKHKIKAGFLVKAEDFHDHDGGEHPEGGKFWGKAGAGCLFYAEDTKRICLQRRAQHIREGGTWATFGGAIEEGETPVEGLKREIYEETGYSGKKKIEKLSVYKNGNFSYHNFIIRVPKEFDPKPLPEFAWETSGFKWVTLDELPEPLHFGIKNLLPALKKYLKENP